MCEVSLVTNYPSRITRQTGL
jgi:hypothetical protein